MSEKTQTLAPTEGPAFVARVLQDAADYVERKGGRPTSGSEEYWLLANLRLAREQALRGTPKEILEMAEKMVSVMRRVAEGAIQDDRESTAWEES